jgi:hypothetical protein
VRHDDPSGADIGDLPVRGGHRRHGIGDGAGLHPWRSGGELRWRPPRHPVGRRDHLADGTRSSLSPHPSVIIGNKPSVHVGQGVFVGQGKGVVPLDDPNAPNKTRCAVLDGMSYCY